MKLIFDKQLIAQLPIVFGGVVGLVGATFICMVSYSLINTT